MLGRLESGGERRGDGQGGLAARRRWVVRKSCTNIRTYCEAPDLVSLSLRSHSAIQLSPRTTTDRPLFLLSSAVSHFHFLLRHGWMTLPPQHSCHQVRLSGDAAAAAAATHTFAERTPSACPRARESVQPINTLTTLFSPVSF